MGNDAKQLKTIIKYCDGIKNAINRFGDSERTFLNDFDYQYTCSFCIAQIGETVKRLSQKITEEHPEIPWSKIAGMRDLIAHEYGGINLNVVWVTIKERIPELKDTCESILEKLEKS